MRGYDPVAEAPRQRAAAQRRALRLGRGGAGGRRRGDPGHRVAGVRRARLGGARAGGWRPRSSSTAATSSTPARCATPGFAYEGIGPPTAIRTRPGEASESAEAGSPDAGTDPGRGRGNPPAPADPDVAEAGHAARRPAVHPLHGRLARPPRGRRRRHGLRLRGRGPARARSATRPRAGPAIPYVEEPEPLGTARAAAARRRRGLLDERFLVLNGDVLADLDLAALMRAHAETGAVATLALYPVDDPSAYGLVRREDGRRGRRVPREARSRRDRHRRDQRRRLRARARACST